LAVKLLSGCAWRVPSGSLRRTAEQNFISLTATRSWWFHECITLLACIYFLVFTNSARHKLVAVLPYQYAKPDYQVEKR
jgi:hypothetical protein